MSRGVLISLTSVLVLVVGGVIVGSDRSAWSVHELIITATHVKKAPTGLDDPVWKKALAVLVPMSGRENLDGKEETVFTRVVYTDDSIYFLFKMMGSEPIYTIQPKCGLRMPNVQSRIETELADFYL